MTRLAHPGPVREDLNRRIHSSAAVACAVQPSAAGGTTT